MPSPNDPTPIALPYLATHRRASAVAALIVEAIPDLSGDGGTMIRVVMESAAPHDIAQLTAPTKSRCRRGDVVGPHDHLKWGQCSTRRYCANRKSAQCTPAA